MALSVVASARDALELDGDPVQRLFELSMDMLGTATTAGHFTRLNPAWERTLGWSVDELMAEPFLSFVHPDDVKATSPASTATPTTARCLQRGHAHRGHGRRGPTGTQKGPTSVGERSEHSEAGHKNPAVAGRSDEALFRTRTGDPFLTMEVLYQLS
jgi:PAS domain-containing protein